MLRNNKEDRSYLVLRGGSLKSRGVTELWPWRWRHHFDSKRQETLTQWHRITFQNYWVPNVCCVCSYQER